MKIKNNFIILVIIIIIGSYLRLQGVFTNSFAYTYDVGRDLLALWDIVQLHKIPLIGATTGLPGIFYGPWWYYFLTPFFIVFSGNPQGIALTMSLIGILTIIIGFVFGKKLGGNFLGLTLAAIISVSPVMISLSAQIWNPNIAPLFVILILLVLNKLYKEEKKDKSKYYFFLGLLLAFNIDLEIVFGLLLSIGIILSVAVIKRRKISIKNIAFFILGELIIFSPRIFFELRHQFLMTKSFIGFFSGGSSSAISKTPELFFNRLNILLDQFNSTLALDNKFLGLLVLLIIFFCLVFFYKKASENIRYFITTSLITVFVFLIGTMFFSHDIWPHYLVGLPVFYILLFGISLYLFRQRISVFGPILIVLAVFLINLNPITLYQSLTKPLWVGDASVYRNQLAVIDYVYGQANGKSFKYVVYTPPLYDYTYKYLFMWYGPKTYHYSPSIQSNLAYFILEPDLQYPSRLTDWLNQRTSDGKIIKNEKLQSGIVIQTRIH